MCRFIIFTGFTVSSLIAGSLADSRAAEDEVFVDRFRRDGDTWRITHAGGPAPGMNTAVRVAVRLGIDRGHMMMAARNGFEGLAAGDVVDMDWMSVHGWVSRGGAELGTSRMVPSGRDLYAIARALDEEMERDPRVIVMGEDIGPQGSVFGTTRGLFEKYGCNRVLDTPISENSFVGCAVGAAITGLRPVVDVMYVDFITLAMDQIINQAAKVRYMYGGKVKVPLVVRTQGGAGKGNAGHHSQSRPSTWK